MNTAVSDTDPIRSLISELRELRQARNCNRGVVSWEINPDCHFWAAIYVVSPTYCPLVGIAAPKVMRRVEALQRRAGINLQRVDWRCAPVFSVPIDSLHLIGEDAGFDRLPAFNVLHRTQALELTARHAILDALFKAEKLLVEKAGKLETLVGFGRDHMPLHPTMTYLIPVGYGVLGRWRESESYLDFRMSQFDRRNDIELFEIYQRFARELMLEKGADH